LTPWSDWPTENGNRLKASPVRTALPDVRRLSPTHPSRVQTAPGGTSSVTSPCPERSTLIVDLDPVTTGQLSRLSVDSSMAVRTIDRHDLGHIERQEAALGTQRCYRRMAGCRMIQDGVEASSTDAQGKKSSRPSKFAPVDIQCGDANDSASDQ